MIQMDASEQTAQLVEKAKSGSRLAFEQLASLFHEDIFRLVYYRTRSTMDTEDLTQDIFLQAFRNLLGLKNTDRFKSWLYSIAVNKVRDFNRKKKFQRLFGAFADGNKESPSEPGSDENPEALNSLMRHEFWEHVGMLLKKLPQMEREVFTLRFMDHLGIKEIAKVLKKNESTVKTHLYRALQKFREEPSMIKLLKEDAS